MPHYPSDTELYADLGESLRAALCDPANADRVKAVGSVIRIDTVRPKAQLTLNLADDAEPEVAFGESDLRPGAVITIDADALRDFFLGEASLIAALSGGKMKAQGPVAPILRVVPLANIVAPVFREREGGSAEPPDEPAGEADGSAEEPEAPAGESEAQADEAEAPAVESEDAAEAPGEDAAEESTAEEPAEEAQS